MSLPIRYAGPDAGPADRNGGDVPVVLALASAERDLLERLRAGDERAFEAVFRTYYRPLYEIALGYVGTHVDAEEVAHDVLMVLWNRRSAIEVRTSLRAYLYTVTRRRALACAGRPRVEAARLDVMQRLPEFAPDRAAASADACLDRTEVRHLIARAVARLPRGQREVFALRTDGELSYAEIAEVLGTTVKNVEVQLRRAVHALRRALPDLTPAADR